MLPYAPTFHAGCSQCSYSACSRLFAAQDETAGRHARYSAGRHDYVCRDRAVGKLVARFRQDVGWQKFSPSRTVKQFLAGPFSQISYLMRRTTGQKQPESAQEAGRDGIQRGQHRHGRRGANLRPGRSRWRCASPLKTRRPAACRRVAIIARAGAAQRF